mmetsp:Transcript_38870/g.108035  ORF Transcript_38870/g.108035 Transcript_38870/m.108035 type:complete len:232 (-) Transcript_38870:151-846(-)
MCGVPHRGPWILVGVPVGKPAAAASGAGTLARRPPAALRQLLLVPRRRRCAPRRLDRAAGGRQRGRAVLPEGGHHGVGRGSCLDEPLALPREQRGPRRVGLRGDDGVHAAVHLDHETQGQEGCLCSAGQVVLPLRRNGCDTHQPQGLGVGARRQRQLRQRFRQPLGMRARSPARGPSVVEGVGALRGCGRDRLGRIAGLGFSLRPHASALRVSPCSSCCRPLRPAGMASAA